MSQRFPEHSPRFVFKRKRNEAQCAGTQAWLLDYLDGSLSQKVKTDVEQHLAECAACRAALTQQQRAEAALLHSAQHLPLPGDLRAGFYARLETTRPTPPRFAGWQLAAPVCAAALLALVLANPFHPKEGSKKPPIDTRDTVHAGTVAFPHPVKESSVSRILVARLNKVPLARPQERPRIALRVSRIRKSGSVPLLADSDVGSMQGFRLRNRRIAVRKSRQPILLVENLVDYRFYPESSSGGGRGAERQRELPPLGKWAAMRSASVPERLPGESLTKKVVRAINSAGVARSDDSAIRQRAFGLTPSEHHDLALRETRDFPTESRAKFAEAQDAFRVDGGQDFEIEVRDTERGFVTNANVQGHTEKIGEQETVTIDADNDTQNTGTFGSAVDSSAR